ncbi:MAG: cytochrome c oxidase assembly protein, partial [Alphaproteobacteria bacterium]
MEPVAASNDPAVLAAVLRSWQSPPFATAAIAATVAVYARGFLALRRQRPDRFPPWRLASFLAAAGLLWVALASPLDALSGLLLSVHMAQHFLLVMVVPPLAWLAAPAIPLLRGLPASWARGLAPILASPGMRRAGHALAHPAVGVAAFTLATWPWHAPGLYELALRDPGWHVVEHATFLAGAFAFWFAIVLPWPADARTPRWWALAALVAADLQNTALCAIFAFSGRPLYASYADAPRLFGTDAVRDQSLAGALMWVPGQFVMLIAVAAVVIGLLGPGRRDVRAAVRAKPQSGAAGFAGRPVAIAHRAPRRGSVDLLRLPILGPLLRSLVLRRALQATMLVVAAAIVVDGFRGPAMAPMNLAGVVPWTWFRGLAVAALVAAGNAVCFACPFVLPRELAKRAFPDRLRRRWPRALRGKGLAAALLVAWFWWYEAAAPWDAPRATAWVVLAYFAAAFAVDAIFRGAAFCKWVCPLGQWNFVASTVSPLSVAVERPSACATCSGHECLRGSPAGRGCETELFLPRKRGNLDCTFCLDCVRACPHDAIGLVARPALPALAADVRGSSIGRPARRPDLALLVLVFVAAAFANAAGMIGPMAGPETGGIASALARTAWIPVATGLLPVAAVAACAAVARRAGRLEPPLREIACRFSMALVPLGVAMWAAHLLFHFATGAGAIVPVLQRAVASVAGPWLGAPDWSAARGLAPDWLEPAKLLVLDVGLCATLWVAWRIAGAIAPRTRPALAAFLPWA